jgi:hypothetical protein
MVRPTQPTLAELAKLRDEIFHGQNIAPGTLSVGLGTHA